MSEPAVLAIRAANPSPMTGQGTNTYILGSGDAVLVVDPGPALPEHVEAVVEAARGAGSVRAVVVTHHHPDHLAAAAEVAGLLGAPLALKPHDLSPEPGLPLREGQRLPCGKGTATVLETPGHAADHLCLWLAEAGTVLAGDLVATEGFIVIDPPDGDMSLYLESLRRVRALTPSILLPGHGAPITSPQDHLDGYIAHRLQREARVLAALREASGAGRDAADGGMSGEASRRGASLAEILPLAYGDTPQMMWPVAERSLLAHLLKLVADGFAERSTAGGEERFTPIS